MFNESQKRAPRACHQRKKQSAKLVGTSLERHDGPLEEFFNRELYRTVQFSIQEQLLRSIEKQFQGGLVFEARRLLYHSTLGRE